MLPMYVVNHVAIICVTYTINILSINSTLYLFLLTIALTNHPIINGCFIDLCINIGYDLATLIV